MMGDHFCCYGLFQVFQLAKPDKFMFFSLSVVIYHVFLNSPMWLLMCQRQSEVLPLPAYMNYNYPFLIALSTVPPPPLCTESKQNNRMTHQTEGVTCMVAL